MTAISKQLEIFEQPPYVGSWSVACIPGFVFGALSYWQRNFGALPSKFVLVACPCVEVHANGGIPSRVIELTAPHHRIQHFTGCHKPYLVILLLGDDLEKRREEVQNLLSWSEGYQVELLENNLRLQFIDATEDYDDE